MVMISRGLKIKKTKIFSQIEMKFTIFLRSKSFLDGFFIWNKIVRSQFLT